MYVWVLFDFFFKNIEVIANFNCLKSAYDAVLNAVFVGHSRHFRTKALYFAARIGSNVILSARSGKSVSVREQKSWREASVSCSKENLIRHSHHETRDKGTPVKLKTAALSWTWQSFDSSWRREDPNSHFNTGPQKLSQAEKSENNWRSICTWPVVLL